MILRIAEAICWAIVFWAALVTDNLIYGCAFLFVVLPHQGSAEGLDDQRNRLDDLVNNQKK